MIGAIIGDIVGSRFEWNNHRSKDFELFTPKCFATDDSIMTLAIGKALMQSKPDWSDLGQQAVRCMQEVGRPYPNCGYGGRFYGWMYSNDPQPYNSFGNGAAMRVSACGFAARSLEEAKILSRKVTEVTHNHPEGIKGAEATAVAIYMARTGSCMDEIRELISREYYPMNFTLNEIRDTYEFNETCQETVPQALMAFFESTGFEDAIRNAISIGGDSDTLAAITGGIAEAYYGVPERIVREAMKFLDEGLSELYFDYSRWVSSRAFTFTDEEEISVPEWELQDRLFSEENMYNYISDFAAANGFTETSAALPYAKAMHEGQLRKGADHVPYINHPLTMACHALALGLGDDVVAVALLHDVYEDCSVLLDELPVHTFNRLVVGLLSFSELEGESYFEAKRRYFKTIAGNPVAAIVKCIDRCNNLSTMASGFSRAKMIEYVEETETFVLPLLVRIKSMWPKYNNAAFLLEYQIKSILETVKRMIMSD